MQRFQVQHFPSIYHITGAETREYDGPRSVQAVSLHAGNNAAAAAVLLCTVAVLSPLANQRLARNLIQPARQYQLAEFAREGWRDVEPRRGCSSPVSSCGRMLGE